MHHLIIADDLTGALAAGGLVAPRSPVRVWVEAVADVSPRSEGFRGANSAAGVLPWRAPGPGNGGAWWAVNAGTRNLTPEAARKTVSLILRSVESVPHRIAHRVDSTGRGNLAAETQAILESRSWSAALCVLAYPAAGRACVGGRLLVHGIAVDRSEAGGDQLNPVRSSDVAALFGDAGRFRRRLLPLSCVRRGSSAVRDRLDAMLTLPGHAWQNRVVIADAETDADIETIAAASASMDVDWIPTDPGPFMALLWAKKTGAPPPPRPERARRSGGLTGDMWLLVIGSIYAKTHAQADYALAAWRESGGRALLRSAADASAASLMSFSPNGPRLVVITAPLPAHPVEKEAARRMASLLGAAGRNVADRLGPAGLIVSGGDTAAAVLAAFGAQTVDVEGLVAPLVPCGRLADGPFAGMRLVTKGGLVGDVSILWRALAHLGATSERPARRRV